MLPGHVEADGVSDSDGVSDAEVAHCVSVLRRLDPTSVERHAELNVVGKNLFRRAIIKERWGESDVVAFMRESAQHKAMLKRLERLQVAIHHVHEEALRAASACEINTRRGEEILAINAEQADSKKAVANSLLLEFEGLRDGEGVIPLTSRQQHMLKMERETSSSKQAYRLKMEEDRSQRQTGSCQAALSAPDAGPDAAPSASSG